MARFGILNAEVSTDGPCEKIIPREVTSARVDSIRDKSDPLSVFIFRRNFI